MILSLIITQRVLIFDAGSSGTRLYMYEYSNSSDPKNFSISLDQTNQPYFFENKQQLSVCLNNESCINLSLFSLLDQLINKLPSDTNLSEILVLLYVLLLGYTYFPK
jgi:hypothetical protein